MSSPDPMLGLAARALISVTVAVATTFVIYKSGLLDYLFDHPRAKSRVADARQIDILSARLRANKMPDIQKLTSHEIQVASCIIDPSLLEVSFDDVGGLDSVKSQIHELIILPLERPELFLQQRTSSLLSFPKGLLLYGPPGTGKTMLAKAIAKQSKSVFLNIHTSFLMNMWYGETNKLVAAVFSLAEKLQPCVIFIDEMESFFKSRGQAYESEAGSLAKTEFMSHWDGLLSRPSSRIIVIGATNRPEDLDPAIIRRMPHRIEVPMPTVAQRLAILKVILRNEAIDDPIDLGQLARLTEGYSGHDLRELCRCAAQVPLRELLKAEAVMNPQPAKPAPTTAAGAAATAAAPATPPVRMRGLRMTDFTEAFAERAQHNFENPTLFARARITSSPPRGPATD